MIAALLNHLWQSTLFAIAAALLTLVFRKNGAHVRYRLWLSASIKFLLPFSLLMTAGAYLEKAPAASKIANEIVAPSLPIMQVSQRFPHALRLAPSTLAGIHWAPLALAIIWVGGLLGVAWMRLRGWRSIRAIVRVSRPMDIPSAIQIRSASPSAVGCWNRA